MIRWVALKDPNCMRGSQLYFPFLGRLEPKKPVSPGFRILSFVALYPVPIPLCLSPLTLLGHSVSLAFKLSYLLRSFLLWFI